MDPQLTRREREIMDVLLRVGEASVEEVRRQMSAPPSYSTVRTLLNRLEGKGHVRHLERGLRYVYSPVGSRARARKTAVERLVDVFYEGSLAKAVTGLLGSFDKPPSAAELKAIEQAIAEARKGERKRGRDRE